MKKLMTRVIIAIILAVTLWTVAPQPAQAQTYCNPYNYSYNYMIYYVRFYNASNSINWYYYNWTYSTYPSNYTTAGFQNYTWSPGDVFYFYIYTNTYAANARIWIDWNNDGDFTDATENVYSPPYSYNPYAAQGSFTIPATAPSGTHRIRIWGGYYYYAYYYGANGCQTYSYNEFEDYALTIAPKNDAGITSINSPANLFDSYQTQDVAVTLKNFSDINLTSVQINWSLDGVQQGTYSWSGNLAKNQTEAVTIATGFTFTPVDPWNPFHIEAWTTNPKGTDAAANGFPDGNANNDRSKTDITCILNDAGFISADAMLPIDFGVNDVKLTIKNFARKPLSRVTINWKVDGVQQSPYTATFNPPLNEGEEATVTVGTYFFGAGNQSYLIEASTSNPNGLADEVPGNDGGSSEVYKALQGGTYTIGATQSDFIDVQEVSEFIGFWGIAGPVTFLIRQGEYYGSFVFQPKGGRQFPMTFESITRRPLDVVIYNDGRDNNNFIFQLDSYDNIIFRNLTFESRTGSYPNIITFINGNNNILFENCVFNGQSTNTYDDNYSILKIMGSVQDLEVNECSFNNSGFGIYSNDQGNLLGSWIHNNNFNGITLGGIILDWTNAPLSSNLNIEENVFNGPSTVWGIAIFNGDMLNIVNNRLNGIDAQNNSGWGGGILVWTSGQFNTLLTSSNVISGNTISVNDAYGVNIQGASFLVKDNVISGTAQSWSGLSGVYASSINTEISHNTINVNGMYGIYGSGDNNTIAYNDIDGNNNQQYNYGGIFLTGMSNSTVADNEITASNIIGLWQENNAHVELSYNSVLNNSVWPAYGFDINAQSGKYQNSGNIVKQYNSSSLSSGTITDKQVAGNKKKDAKELGSGPGNVLLQRNLFQNNAGGIVAEINNPTLILQSDGNNWWSNGAVLFNYNYSGYASLADYQAASGLDLTSSSVEAKFLSPTDLRLTDVNDQLYFTQQMFYDNRYDEYEKYDLGGVERTKTFYKGAHSILPTITMAEEPEDVVDCYGTTDHSFTVIANVDYNATLTYQWYKDGVEIFGATGPILYINEPMDFEMGAVYQCKVMANGEAEPIWTRPALLYTMRPTEITRQPDNVRNNLGDVSLFEIDMHIYKEVPALYQPDIQWYRGGQMLTDNDKIAGTKSSIMTIRDLQPEDYGNDYYVIISGLCGADTSANISLTEIPKLTVEDLAGTMTICEGEDVSWTVNATSNVQGLTMIYKWMKDGAELTDGGRITGATTANLVIMGATAADAGEYMCKVTLEGWDETITNASVLTVNTAPIVTTDLEASVSVQTGRDLVLTVAADGADLMYQWYFNGAEITGETGATLTKTNVQTTDEGIYKVKVYNICGEVYSAECTVTITPYILLGKDDAQAGEYILNQNSPNPFAGATIIGFILPDASHAKLAITDVYGRELAVIADKSMPAGLSQFTVNSNELNLTSGVYFYTLTVSGKSMTKTMVIVK